MTVSRFGGPEVLTLREVPAVHGVGVVMSGAAAAMTAYRGGVQFPHFPYSPAALARQDAQAL
jgi:hypothetical protein